MRYQFNFGFLSQWLEANPDIQKNAILYAAGTKANNSFKSWTQGEGAMPIITILRFCNSFQVPISAFIKDLDDGKEAITIPALPSENDILEPVGGFLSIDDRRGRGERSLLNPLDVKVTPSVVGRGHNNTRGWKHYKRSGGGKHQRREHEAYLGDRGEAHRTTKPLARHHRRPANTNQ